MRLTGQILPIGVVVLPVRAHRLLAQRRAPTLLPAERSMPDLRSSIST